MRNKTYRFSLALFALAIFLPAVARAQLLQVDNFTIDPAVTGTGVNLLFNKLDLSPTKPFYITLKITSITYPVSSSDKGYFLGTENDSIPSATFSENITLSNASPAPAPIVATDNYTGTLLNQNEKEPIIIPASGPNSFSPVPDSSTSEITQNLVNFEGTSGTFDLNVNSLFSISNLENGNPESFYPVINGTLTVSASPLPEPSTWILLFAGLGLIAGWRMRPAA